MKTTCTILFAFFMLSACNKKDLISELKISFRSDAPILIANYGVGGDDNTYYYPPLNFAPTTPMDKVSNNFYEVSLSVDMSIAEFLAIYTKIDTSSLNEVETVNYEILIVDQKSGEIKYKRKMETTEEYNRELIQL